MTSPSYEAVGFVLIGNATTRLGPALRLERRLDDPGDVMVGRR